MSNLLAFPMYAVRPADTVALWQAVRSLLAERGVVADGAALLDPDADLLAHWQHPKLILSQTCGYPLVTRLPEVQVVGCFHYAAPGCEGPGYRSVLVAREEDKHRPLAAFRGRRAVCNAADSLSGYHALLYRVAPLAVNGSFFSRTRFSGSHRQSLIDLRREEGDIAAIDCVTWALLQRHEPTLCDGLAVVDTTPLAPGLPLITARDTPAATLQAIREALHTLVQAPACRETCAAQLIDGFSVTTRQAYAQLQAWRAGGKRGE